MKQKLKPVCIGLRPRAEKPQAFVYSRVSTQDQLKSGLSIEAQKDAASLYFKAKIEPKGVEFGGFFIDAASARKMKFLERPAGHPLHYRLRRGDHIIISKTDRAFRRMSDCTFMMELWEEEGVIVHMLDVRGMDIDASTDLGRLIVHILGAFAEWERARISERTIEALRQSTKKRKPRPPGYKNQWPGYGWRYIRTKGGKRKRVPDEEERVVMQKIVKWKLAGSSWEEIYFHLLRYRVKTREGTEWSMQRVQRAFYTQLAVLAAEKSEQSALTPASAGSNVTQTQGPGTPDSCSSSASPDQAASSRESQQLSTTQA